MQLHTYVVTAFGHIAGTVNTKSQGGLRPKYTPHTPKICLFIAFLMYRFHKSGWAIAHLAHPATRPLYPRQLTKALFKDLSVKRLTVKKAYIKRLAALLAVKRLIAQRLIVKRLIFNKSIIKISDSKSF